MWAEARLQWAEGWIWDEDSETWSRDSLLKEVSLRKGKEFDAAEAECFRKETTWVKVLHHTWHAPFLISWRFLKTNSLKYNLTFYKIHWFNVYISLALIKLWSCITLAIIQYLIIPLPRWYPSCPFNPQSHIQLQANTHVLRISVGLPTLDILYKLYNMWSFMSGFFDLVCCWWGSPML